MSSLRTLLVAILLLGASLAGCLGSSEEVAPNTGGEEDQKKEPPICRLPDGRLCAAANETNKTTVGKGGIEHKHDYWHGETTQVIFEGPLKLDDPLFCDNKDTNKFGCAILQLPVTTPAVLVYEGASSMTIEISELQPWVTGLEMRYKNGANPLWGDAFTFEGATPVTIPITPIETDMPHSSASQWAWKFIGTRATGPSTVLSPLLTGGAIPADFIVKISVHKGGQVVNWPGHPDFYDNKTHRVVMDKSATTKVGGITDSILYGDEANIVRPDLLISSGTGKIKVYLNVTEVRAQTGPVKPDDFFIEYSNATGYWEGDYDESGWGVNRVFGNKTGPMSWEMEIPVTHTGWDSPYAPVSGWQFLVRSSYSDPAGGGWCPGCFPYEVDFHMTVIAFPDPKYVGEDDALEA